MALVKCEECGQMVSDQAGVCPQCGAPIERKVQCAECGNLMSESVSACPVCGCPKSEVQDLPAPDRRVIFTGTDYSNKGESGKSRLTFCFLGWVFGLLGVHLFYIGKVGAAFFNLGVFLLVLLLEIVCFWSFIHSISGYYDEPNIGLLILMPILLLPVIAIVIIFYYQLIRVALMTQDEFEREYVFSEKFYPI